MLSTDHIFKNSQLFPTIKRFSRVFVSKQAVKSFKHSAKLFKHQTISLDFEVFRENQKLSLVFEKLSHMFEL